MDRLVVILAGNPGAGKTKLIAPHLKDEFGFSTARPSQIISGYAAERGLPLHNRAEFRSAFKALINEQGVERYIGNLLAGEGNLCIDGERVPDNVRRLQKQGAVVLALWCPIDVRFNRVMADPERIGRDQSTFEAFRAEEQAEYEIREPFGPSTLTIMQMADYWIDAGQSPAQVLKAVDIVVKPHMQPVAA